MNRKVSVCKGKTLLTHTRGSLNGGLQKGGMVTADFQTFLSFGKAAILATPWAMKISIFLAFGTS